MSAFAATALAALLALQAAPAEAGLFGKKDKAEKAETARPAAGVQTAAPQAPPRATPEERAAIERMDPLARAAFWAREYDRDPTDAEAGVALARALRAMGRNDEAANTAQRLVSLTPNHVEGQLEMARAHIARGQGF
ncbi:MAG: tetratricopeptide repeat protein, partial [Phenylobacterium sp.]|nr:tetratricopeptide repeat protein [Phenylobacterium sp.]